MTRSLAAIVLAFALFAPRAAAWPPAGSESLEEVRATARTALVERLLGLAQWCNQNDLFEERDRVWRLVIGVDADNLEARKGLRYARNTDGSWKDPSPRPVKNRNAAALEQLPAKRAEAIGPFRDALFERLKAEDVPAEVRRSVLDEILSIDPDDAGVHEMLGEARLEDRWVLRESVAAKARRAEIRTAVQTAKEADIPLEPAAPTAEETTLFDGWKCGSTCDGVRVIGSGDAAQCESLARICQAAGAVVETALGAPAQWSTGFSFYVLTGAGEKDAFIAKLPGLDEAQRATMKKTIGGGIPGTWKVVIFEPDAAKRQDCSVRHGLAHLLFTGWKIETKHAWIFEGLGLYLTREICGTRLTWFCSGAGVASEGKNSPRGRLMVADSNWMNEALKVLTKDPPPDLGAMFERDLPSFGVEDVLMSYALCAYLVEACPQAVSPLLKDIGEGTPSAAALEKALGWNVPELQARLVRWLKERK